MYTNLAIFGRFNSSKCVGGGELISMKSESVSRLRRLWELLLLLKHDMTCWMGYGWGYCWVEWTLISYTKICQCIFWKAIDLKKGNTGLLLTVLCVKCLYVKRQIYSFGCLPLLVRFGASWALKISLYKPNLIRIGWETAEKSWFEVYKGHLMFG